MIWIRFLSKIDKTEITLRERGMAGTGKDPDREIMKGKTNTKNKINMTQATMTEGINEMPKMISMKIYVMMLI